MEASEIVRALGGPTAVATSLRIGRTAVSNWGKAGVPSKFWPALCRLAREQKVKAITLDVLEHHTAPRKAAV